MAGDLPVPPGQGDDGSADPGLRAALASGDPDALAAALAGARVFVGVEARLVSADAATGADKTSDMDLVTLRTDTGATALPVFSSVALLAEWRPQARPVPVAAAEVCAEAVRLGHETVVIDLAGPASATVDVTGYRRSEVPARVAGDSPDSPDGAPAGLHPPARPLDGRARRRVRAALGGLPADVRVWHADLVGPRALPGPVFAVAVPSAPGEVGDRAVAEVARRLREAFGGVVLTVDAAEVPALRRHLGRGLRRRRTTGRVR
jgi:hypothetical protein